MAILKSLVVGILAMAAVIILGAIAISFSLRTPEGQVGWDVVSLVKQSPLVWLLLALAFSGGFIWEYRRLSRHRVAAVSW